VKFTNKKSYEIRWAKEKDWLPAIEMVWQTFLRFEGKDYSPEGIENFRDFLFSEELRDTFLHGEYPVLIALDEDRIVGMGSIRGKNRLSLLFVDANHQGCGIGRKLLDGLCTYLEGERHESSMRVFAAPYAVAFYKRHGFLAEGPMEEVAGIRVMAMRKHLENERIGIVNEI
jgi:GNAT superfamily N-acetyltransferase